MRTISRDQFHGRIWDHLPDDPASVHPRSPIAALWRGWRNRRRTARAISGLDDHLLRDICRDEDPPLPGDAIRYGAAGPSDMLRCP
ncbi:MAG: DUF1127 domain-containing protein [Rhizobiaceae bacterium]